MLEYNSERNVLYFYKNEVARPDIRKFPEESSVRTSYQDYLANRVADDVKNFFTPTMLRKLGQDARLEVKDIRTSKAFTPGYYNDMSILVQVKFDIPQLEPTQQWITIMRIPSVDEDGIVRWEQKEYSFIHMLEQEPTVSYEANATTNKSATLKIKSQMRTLCIQDASKLTFTLSDRVSYRSNAKKNYHLICLVAAMADHEGYDVEKLWSEYAGFSIINMFKDEADKNLHLYFYGGNKNNINASEYVDELIPRLTLERITQNGVGDESYENSLVRDSLNNLLSLDRARGEILAKDVESILEPGTIVAHAGETVDSSMLRLFQRHGVYVIYVDITTSIAGYYLRQNVFVKNVPIGTRIPKSLRHHFPGENGMYTSKDYINLELPVPFMEGEYLTDEILQFIKAVGYTTILVSDKKTGGRVRTFNFYEEIMSNRQFDKSYIPADKLGRYKDSEEQFFYMDANGDFIPNTGKYTAYDFAALLSFCTKLFEGKWVDSTVNADAGFRKVLIPIAEQYHRAFRYACENGLKMIGRTLKEMYKKPETRIRFYEADGIENSFYPLTKQFWKYLTNEAKCMQLLGSDCIHNPVSYVSACTKVNVYTANKHSVAASQRDIATGSYAKVDPYEIPQSQKMGTVFNAAIDSVVNSNGAISTLYYKVMMGRVITTKKIPLTASEEEKYVIADICSLDLDSEGRIKNMKDSVMCRIPSTGTIEKQTFGMRPVSAIEYVNIHANQPLSWASATIPFMSSNDAARAIFAVAQEKAVKGLIVPEEPDLMTSAWEQIPFLNDKFCFIAKDDGVVDAVGTSASTGKIQVDVRYDTPLENGDINGQNFIFDQYFDSGYSITKLSVREDIYPGYRFKKGEVIVYSNFVSPSGIMTLGCNALVAYICDGYNYEDGAHISQRMSERMVSYKLNHQEFKGSINDQRFKVSHPKYGRYISADAGDTIELERHRSHSSRKDILSENLNKVHGFFEKEESIVSETGGNNYGTTAYFISADHFVTADKSSNRHGNKGVASAQIEPTANMPRLMNGMPIDICYNPLGVGSRMNIGQVREANCGLCAHVLQTHISTDAYNSMNEHEIRELMNMTVDLMNSTGDISGIISEYKKKGMIPAGFEQHIIEHIDMIRDYAGCFDKQGCTNLMLPTNDGRYAETKVLIGYMYVYGLIQQSSSKLHARGGETMGERYGSKSDAPTHGSSVGGGQRLGTMEIDALCAYGVSNYIQELTNERCDNAIARTNSYVSTYLPAKLKKRYYNPKPGQRRAVTQFLYSMLALGVVCEPEDGEFLPISKDNNEQLSHYKVKAIKSAELFTKREEDTSQESQETEEKKDYGDGVIATKEIMDTMYGKGSEEDKATNDGIANILANL